MTVKAITSRGPKRQRISALEPEVAQGMIAFSRRHELLIEQLTSFPLGRHDDGPDALEMAIQCVREPSNWYQMCDAYTGRVLYDSRYGENPDPSLYW